MKATYKAPAMDAFLSCLMGSKRVECIERGWCMTCDAVGIPCPDEFYPDGYWRDALSLKEYRISGMCQSCQDEAFSQYSEE